MKGLDANTLTWGQLLLAGLFEIGFTTSMNFFGKARYWPEALFLVCIIASFTFLGMATKTLPIGIAYAVWTGIGAAGTLAVSTLVFRAPITLAQVGFVLLLITAIVGLKLTSAKA